MGNTTSQNVNVHKRSLERGYDRNAKRMKFNNPNNNNNNNNNRLNAALISLSELNEKIDSLSNDTQGTKAVINDIKKQLTKNQTAQNCQSAINVCSSVVENIDNFKSGNALDVASGVLNIIGTIATTVNNPYGAVIGSLCSLIASVLPLFGGGSKEKGLADVVKEVIDKALDDYKDADIDEKLQGIGLKIHNDLTFLFAIGSKNGGKLQDNEKGAILEGEFRNRCLTVLGALKSQIERNQATTNHDKAKKIAKYIYYWCMLSTMRKAVISFQCSLLKVNQLNGILRGQLQVLNDYKIDKALLNFIHKPTAQNRKIYRYIQTDEVLDYKQKQMIQQYRAKAGCRKMEGFYCEIYNVNQSEYLYAADYKPYDGDRRRVFSLRNGKRVCAGGWRIFGNLSRCQIYNIYQGEYLYAADYAPFDGDRRRVFTWRNGKMVRQGDWKIQKKGSGRVSIFNMEHKEYLYAADYAPFDGDRRRIFTWRNGKMVTQGYWTLKYKNEVGEK